MRPLAGEQEDEVYPPEFAGRRGWEPSTEPTPISPLEFDLRAEPFVHGFGRALRDMLGPGFDVGVRRSGGHLFTLVDQRGLDPGEGSRFEAPEDFREHWAAAVRPATLRRLDRLAHAIGEPVHRQVEILDAAVGWVAELTYLHHTLLLPARVALGEFAELVVDLGLAPSEVAALSLLAGHENATVRAASRLWYLRDTPDHGRAGELSSLLTDCAHEGEGYGLQHPGWLESPTVPVAIVAAYATTKPEQAPERLLHAAARRREEQSADLTDRLQLLPTQAQHRYDLAYRRARSAIAITEDHAPLMHARLGYELRRLVLSIGVQLMWAGDLQYGSDVVWLHLDELREGGRHRRQLARERRWKPHGPPPAVSDQDDDAPTRPPDPAGNSRLAGYVKQIFGSDPRPAPTSTRITQGQGGSSGRATGRLRRVRRQHEIGTVRPGEVLLAPSNSAVWSFALPMAAAVVAPGGSRFGHLASLARDYGRPAVVGLGSLDHLDDGELVDIDGDAGTVTRCPPDDKDHG